MTGANQSGSKAVNLVAAAIATLAKVPGWHTDFSQELACHPALPALTFQDPNSEVALTLCPQCLRVYLAVGMGIVATGSDMEEKAVCNRCQREGPRADFIGNSGFPTRFCSACRLQWGKDKRKAEKEAQEAAAALEEEDVKKTLAAMRVDLRRLERQLGEE